MAVPCEGPDTGATGVGGVSATGGGEMRTVAEGMGLAMMGAGAGTGIATGVSAG